MSLLIIGCGYVGRVLARDYQAKYPGQNVYALTRSHQNAVELSRQDILPLVGHWMVDSLEYLLPKNLHAIVVAVPHREDPLSNLPPDSDQHHVLGLENLMQALHKQTEVVQRLPRLIYLSTTGVFGDSARGQTVDEHTPVSPNRIGPRIAVAAESWIAAYRDRWPAAILRLAGIYGPGRIPLLNQMSAGQPLAVARDGLLNLIHVDDIARAVMWLIEAQSPAPLYLLSDGHPVRREDFYLHLAKVAGLPQPQFIDPVLAASQPAGVSSNARHRRSADKAVDPQLFWRESGLERPIFLDYRQGLASCIE